MHKIEGVIEALDYLLNTKRKKHIVGGVLMSMALLLGGLSVTVMSLKDEEKEDNEKYIE